MKRVRYTKYTGDLASEMSMEDLLQALSDYLLDSGFRNPFMQFQELDHTLDDLREALRQALESGELFDENMQEAIDAMAEDGRLDELIDKLVDRLERENLHFERVLARSWRDLPGRRTSRRRTGTGSLRSYRQEPRLSRLQDAAGPAWVPG